MSPPTRNIIVRDFYTLELDCRKDGALYLENVQMVVNPKFYIIFYFARQPVVQQAGNPVELFCIITLTAYCLQSLGYAYELCVCNCEMGIFMNRLSRF